MEILISDVQCPEVVVVVAASFSGPGSRQLQRQWSLPDVQKVAKMGCSQSQLLQRQVADCSQSSL